MSGNGWIAGRARCRSWPSPLNSWGWDGVARDYSNGPPISPHEPREFLVQGLSDPAYQKTVTSQRSRGSLKEIGLAGDDATPRHLPGWVACSTPLGTARARATSNITHKRNLIVSRPVRSQRECAENLTRRRADRIAASRILRVLSDFVQSLESRSLCGIRAAARSLRGDLSGNIPPKRVIGMAAGERARHGTRPEPTWNCFTVRKEFHTG